MRRFLCILLCLALLGAGTVFAEQPDLVPVGEAVSLRLDTDGVFIVKFDEAQGQAPALRAGLKEGDRIVSVDGVELQSVRQLQGLVQGSGGAELIFCVRRADRPMSFTVRPAPKGDGWTIGVYVRDRVNGVGTVTWYDPDTGLYGALGHGVNEGDCLLPLAGGEAGAAEIVGVLKGEEGNPGALRAAAGEPVATVEKNTDCGLFGRVGAGVWTGEAIPAARRDQVQPGPAEILCCVEGREAERYAIVIESLRYDPDAGRDLTIRVTDQRLLEKTGGIVQGMSGSPILQGGRIVGAVTHVLVRDPSRGYGILIERMLDAAGTGDN